MKDKVAMQVVSRSLTRLNKKLERDSSYNKNDLKRLMMSRDLNKEALEHLISKGGGL